MNTPLGKSTVGEMLPYFIAIIILILFSIFCIRMIIVTSKNGKKLKQRQLELKEQGMSIYTAFQHVNGLPIAENLLCKVFSYPDRIEFKSGTTRIKLERKKLLICVLNLTLKFRIKWYPVSVVQ